MSITLRRFDPDRDMRWFYNSDLQPGLFGAVCLVKGWGRISRGGEVRNIPCSSISRYADPERQRRVKEHRGYVSSLQ